MARPTLQRTREAKPLWYFGDTASLMVSPSNLNKAIHSPSLLPLFFPYFLWFVSLNAKRRASNHKAVIGNTICIISTTSNIQQPLLLLPLKNSEDLRNDSSSKSFSSPVDPYDLQSFLQVQYPLRTSNQIWSLNLSKFCANRISFHATFEAVLRGLRTKSRCAGKNKIAMPVSWICVLKLKSANSMRKSLELAGSRAKNLPRPALWPELGEERGFDS